MADQVEFADRTRRSQIHWMRRVAVDVLADYAVEPTSISLVAHAHNTTFRVDAADGRRFALRINLNSRSTAANLDAETAWLVALAAESSVVAPVPVATRDGRRYTSRHSDALGRELAAVLNSWLPGSNLERPTPEAVRELGRLAARLHEHAVRWTMPNGAEFPSHATVLVDDPNRIQGDHRLLTPAVREVVDEAMKRTQAHYDAVHASAEPQALHADLHSGNVKWRHGAMAVFDFDDAVWGVPAFDLGIAAYYLRVRAAHRGEPALEEELLAGYESIAPLPRFSDAEFEAMLAGRNLLLMNEVLAATTADVVAVQQQYVDNTTLILRGYLDSGIYRPAVPGVIPLRW